MQLNNHAKCMIRTNLFEMCRVTKSKFKKIGTKSVNFWWSYDKKISLIFGPICCSQNDAFVLDSADWLDHIIYNTNIFKGQKDTFGLKNIS